MDIRLAQIEDAKQILDVLNEVTLDLKQKEIQQWDHPWDSEKLVSLIKNNCCYAMLIEHRIIGSFCISDLDHFNDIPLERESIYLSQIAISPNFQGNGLGSMVLEFALSIAKTLNKALYLDCWAGNEKLKQFYINNGLDYMGDYPEEDYFISVFTYNLT